MKRTHKESITTEVDAASRQGRDITNPDEVEASSEGGNMQHSTKRARSTNDDEEERERDLARHNILHTADVGEVMRMLRAKAEWQNKITDPTIVTKWHSKIVSKGASDELVSDALMQLFRESVTGQYFPRLGNMLTFTTQEERKLLYEEDHPGQSCKMKWFNDIDLDRDSEDGPGTEPRDDVYWADKIVPNELRTSLEALLDAIATASNKEGSCGKVQNLIDPSLFPYIRGLSYETEAQQEYDVSVKTKISQRFFQMAASIYDSGRYLLYSRDIQLEDSSDEKQESGSLDDIPDPESNKLMKLLENVESVYQWLPAEFFVDRKGNVSIDSYINNLDRELHSQLYDDIARLFRIFVPLLEKVMHTQHTNKRLQVIVKAVNYVLKPGESYEGDWHLVGMPHEHIAAVGIYYYGTTSNLTRSSVAFRELRDNDLDKRAETQSLSFSLNIGKADAPEGRCLVFSNHLQHKVRKMTNRSQELAVCKILYFYIVDPNHRIKSSRDVPRQQWDKVRPAIRRALIEATVRYKVPLPLEIMKIIMEKAKWGFTLEEANVHREVLIKERKYVMKANNELWEREFSFS